MAKIIIDTAVRRLPNKVVRELWENGDIYMSDLVWHASNIFIAISICATAFSVKFPKEITATCKNIQEKGLLQLINSSNISQRKDMSWLGVTV